MHLPSSAVRVQPVRRSGALRLTSWQRAHRRWMGGPAEVGRVPLSRQAVAHQFSAPTPASPIPRSTSISKAKGSDTPSGCLPTASCRIASATCSSGLSAARRLMPGAPTRTSPTKRESWTKPRRVVAKVEWHPGELYPRVGFIVTNMARPAENVVAFYNKRGTCEQWIKEGKGAIRWTRLSCRSFAANAVRLQLHALAYNLGNFLRTLATPEPIKDWSLTSLKEKLIKIGAKVVRHDRLSPSRWPRSPFRDICSSTSFGSSRNYGRRRSRQQQRN
jgi:hypothetical protein